MKKIKDIPFAIMTEGQASLSIATVNEKARATLFRKKGRITEADQCAKRAAIYESAVLQGLHNNANFLNLNSIADPVAINIINVARTKIGPALRSDPKVINNNADGLNNLNNPDLPFDPTTDQIDECTDFVKQKYANQYGIPNIFSLAYRGESLQRRALADRNACISQIPYENMVKEHVAQSGGVIMYQVWGDQNTTYNNATRNKYYAQGQWIDNIQRVTGLARESIIKVLDTSIIETFDETPEDLEKSFGPYLAMKNFGGLDITAQTKTPDIIFQKDNNSPIGFKTDDPLINLIINIGVYIIKFLFKKWKEKNEQIKRREGDFIEIGEPSQITMECTDFNNVSVDCSSEKAINKVCKNELGEIVECEEESGGGSGLLIAGLVVLVGGIMLFGRKKEASVQGFHATDEEPTIRKKINFS